MAHPNNNLTVLKTWTALIMLHYVWHFLAFVGSSEFKNAKNLNTSRGEAVSGKKKSFNFF
jgi:hypothetical protein